MARRGHIAVGGSSGKGKTNYALHLLLATVAAGEKGVCAHFPHREAGEEFLLHLEDRGHLDRVVVFDTKDVRRVLGKQLIWASGHPDPFQRDAENEEYATHFLGIAARTRKDIKDLRERSAIFRNAKLAIQVYQNLDAGTLWLPPFEIPRILEKGSDVQAWALRHCTHERYRRQLERLSRMPLHEQVAKVVPAEDFLDGFLNTTVIRAMGSVRPRFSLPDHLKRCRTGEPGVYVGLGGGSDDIVSLTFGSDYQQIAQDAKSSPCAIPRVVLQDECFNYWLLTEVEGRNLNTLRAFGVEYVGIFQTYPKDQPTVVQAFRAATDKVLFGSDDWDTALEFAKDQARAADEYKVHHEVVSTRFRPVQRDETRVSTGTWVGPDGKGGKSVTEAPTTVTDHEEFREVTPQYQGGQEQLFWLARQNRGQGVGEATFVFGTDAPYRARVPLVRPVCPFAEDARREASRCLARVMAQDLYAAPAPFALPPPPREQPPAGRPAPRPTGGAAERARRNARRRS